MEKTFDAVVGDTAIVANRCQYAEFTHPYAESGVQILVLKEENESRAWMFMKPFTIALWALTAITNMYNGFVVWLIERADNKYFHEGTVWHQIGTSVWFSFSTLFSRHGGELRSSLSRVVTVVWLFVALVLTSSYTASLTSTLTTQQLKPRYVDVDSLLKSNAKVGCDKGSFVVKYVEEVLGFHPNNIIKYDYQEAPNYPEALKSGEIQAAFLEVPYMKLLLAYNCKGFTTIGSTYEVGGFGFVFPKGSPLVQDVTEAILQVRESGQMRELEDGLIASSKCPSSEDNNKNDRLSLDSFIGLFAITIGTSTIALVLFFFRLLRNYWHMYMKFYLLFLIHQMRAYWQMYANVHRMMLALEMKLLRQHPRRRHGLELVELRYV